MQQVSSLRSAFGAAQPLACASRLRQCGIATRPFSATASAMELENTYWLMRHGRSRANEAKLIVSRLENGVKPEYGLSEFGEAQAHASGEKLRVELGSEQQNNQLAIYASPFSRTMQTAQLVAEQLALPGAAPCKVQPAPELRERDFGAFELQSDENYPGVWEQDAVSTASKPTPDGAGETVEEVAARFRSLLTTLEERERGRTILLVAHGDTLSIGTAAVRNYDDMRQHKSSFYLGTAEFMPLK